MVAVCSGRDCATFPTRVILDSQLPVVVWHGLRFGVRVALSDHFNQTVPFPPVHLRLLLGPDSILPAPDTSSLDPTFFWDSLHVTDNVTSVNVTIASDTYRFFSVPNITLNLSACPPAYQARNLGPGLQGTHKTELVVDFSFFAKRDQQKTRVILLKSSLFAGCERCASNFYSLPSHESKDFSCRSMRSRHALTPQRRFQIART